MASRQTIKFDFKKALGQADKIDAIAERLNRLSGTEFGNTMQNENQKLSRTSLGCTTD